MAADADYLRLALRLARRGRGATSPNPMVGAVLLKAGRIIGQGWHRRAGEPHAEIEALADAQRRGFSPKGATLYVTLEPCCTHGRTPPCTEAIISAGLKRVVIGATDPNPRHSGRGYAALEKAGLKVSHGLLEAECAGLNEAFNHWIVQRTPWVTVKAAMTLDGKIATASGQSKWITGERARAYAMRLRYEADAILAGINTVLLDDPSLTARAGVRYSGRRKESLIQSESAPGNSLIRDSLRRLLQYNEPASAKALRRIILDSNARTPLKARIVSDPDAALTTIVVGNRAPKSRVAALRERVNVLVAPLETGQGDKQAPRLDLAWLLQTLGSQEVTSLLVEGGGEVNASFLMQGLAHRVAFFYAPIILGGRDSRKAAAGPGAATFAETLPLMQLKWRRLDPDWLLTARVGRS